MYRMRYISVARDLCQDPKIYSAGVGYSGYTHSYAEDFVAPAINIHNWYRFIRRMILSDVNIIHRRTHYEGEAEDFEVRCTPLQLIVFRRSGPRRAAALAWERRKRPPTGQVP